MTNKTDGIIIRNAAFNDIPAIVDLEIKTWGKESSLTPKMIESCLKVYQKGSYVVVCGSEIAGFVVTSRVRYDNKNDCCSWYEIADNGFIAKTHDPAGNTLFGMNLTVSPDFQNNGIGQRMVKTVCSLAIDINVEQGMLGARIPDYHKYAVRIPVDDYVKIKGFDEKTGIAQDPELAFYLREYFGARFEPVKVIPNYFKDADSLNYGVLLRWKNLQYKNI